MCITCRDESNGRQQSERRNGFHLPQNTDAGEELANFRDRKLPTGATICDAEWLRRYWPLQSDGDCVNGFIRSRLVSKKCEMVDSLHGPMFPMGVERRHGFVYSHGRREPPETSQKHEENCASSNCKERVKHRKHCVAPLPTSAKVIVERKI
jgi:hypothetical protein